MSDSDHEVCGSMPFKTYLKIMWKLHEWSYSGNPLPIKASPQSIQSHFLANLWNLSFAAANLQADNSGQRHRLCFSNFTIQTSRTGKGTGSVSTPTSPCTVELDWNVGGWRMEDGKKIRTGQENGIGKEGKEGAQDIWDWNKDSRYSEDCPWTILSYASPFWSLRWLTVELNLKIRKVVQPATHV